MNNHLLIESDGALYRCDGYYFPEEIWSENDQVWKPYKGKVPKEPAWGDVISEEEVDAFKKAL